MKNLSIRLLVLIGLAVSTVSYASSEGLTSQEDSAKLVEILSSDTIKILTSDVDQTAKEAQIRAVLVENLDIERIGILIAGKAARKATDSQKAQYKPLVREYLEIKYSRLLGGYNGQTIKIINTGRAGKYDALVITHIIQKDQGPVKVSWRVSNKREKLLVLDVIVEGISMLRTERGQFEAVLQSKKFDGLIEMLEKKVAEMTAIN